MARFIVIHMTPEKVTQDEIIEAGRTVVASQVRGARWLNSWVAGEAEKLFCEWEAPDAEAVRASMKPVIHLFPVKEMHEVIWVNPEWYAE